MEADNYRSRWVLELEEEDPGAHFRVRNTPGQINREDIINRGEKFQVIADLAAVVHGTLTPALASPAEGNENANSTSHDDDDNAGGEPGALIVIDFQLVPKPGRRFSGANLTVIFTTDKPSDIVVSVVKIAPHPSWGFGNTTRDDTSSWTLSPTVAVSPAEVGVGEVGRSHAQTRTFHTTVDGTMRFENRVDSGKDAARWVLDENTAQKTGVARWLRTAIVVRLSKASNNNKPRLTRQDVQDMQFSATVDMIAVAPLLSLGWVEEKLEWLTKRMPVDDPVVFQCGKNWKSNQLAVSVDKNNLLGVDLNGIIGMNLHKNFESLAEAGGH